MLTKSLLYKHLEKLLQTFFLLFQYVPQENLCVVSAPPPITLRISLKVFPIV